MVQQTQFLPRSCLYEVNLEVTREAGLLVSTLNHKIEGPLNVGLQLLKPAIVAIATIAAVFSIATKLYINSAKLAYNFTVQTAFQLALALAPQISSSATSATSSQPSKRRRRSLESISHTSSTTAGLPRSTERLSASTASDTSPPTVDWRRHLLTAFNRAAARSENGNDDSVVQLCSERARSSGIRPRRLSYVSAARQVTEPVATATAAVAAPMLTAASHADIGVDQPVPLIPSQTSLARPSGKYRVQHLLLENAPRTGSIRNNRCKTYTMIAAGVVCYAFSLFYLISRTISQPISYPEFHPQCALNEKPLLSNCSIDDAPPVDHNIMYSKDWFQFLFREWYA